MSHNTTKVKNVSADVSSDIDLSIDDLVTGSPSDGDTISYTSGAWGFTATSGLSGNAAYLLVGRGESNDYSNSGATGSPAVGDAWYFYDTSPDNQIGATLNITSDWITSIDLPVGKYIVECQIYCEFTASGRLGTRLYRHNTQISSTGTIGDSLTYSDNQGSNCIGHIEITSSHVTNATNRLELRIDSLLNVADYTGAGTTQGTTPSQFSYLLILKVG
jgi:hypothetical protein